MARFSPTRANFLVPGAVKVADKRSDAVAYIYERKGRLFGQMFYGKQAKPVASYYFRSAAERETTIRRYFDGRRASVVRKAEDRAKRTAANLLATGNLLRSSWGYDQTNVDFYQVTEVAGAYVTIRKIAGGGMDVGSYCGSAPEPGRFVGESMRKLVQFGSSVKITSYATASKV